MAELMPVVPVRHLPGTVRETSRIVHLIPMPTGEPAAVSALCGTLLNVHDIETVSAGEGMPCDTCLLSQVINTSPETPVESTDSTSQIREANYQAWNWPVIRHGDQVRLILNCETSAIAVPAELGIEVTEILTARRCAPPVLVHPYMPDHHVILTGERTGIMLSWPPSVHQVTGFLLLPPTVTQRGSITWIRSPTKDSLQLCREIDVFAALRIALNRTERGNRGQGPRR